ncbi:DUF2142 domain-containing protein [Parafrankia sp. EUN1f]|uniref:DUF2142 domain-containing protein n=1 Tax=Parafrankia sp. EUN1f TaxID=102897 RepID=UPI0001C46FD2|nr:DUF2142 domain-containing protein [Parafrankia sp. EUN1f]EFC86287.1 hypothetical protein FrEUN1fDRAFT_0557 [Parafrankia sp. EUN1f]
MSEYPGGIRFRPLVLLRSVPLPIWLITALFGALLACWSVLVPQYHAPDEPNHVDAVLRLVQGDGWPHPGHAFVKPDGVGAIAASPYGSEAVPYELDHAPIVTDDATPRADRPDWDELGQTRQADGDPQPPGDIQQLVQHPPLYYWVGAAVLWALPGGGDGDGLRWDVTIGALRLMSALMVMWLPVLAWAGAHRLSGGNRIAATCAALVPLAVPELSHIGSSVNNDNLLALTTGLATLTIIYILRGDTSLRTAAWAGGFIGLALLTKSLAIVLVPMAALAYLVAWLRARRDDRHNRTSRASRASNLSRTGQAERGRVRGRGTLDPDRDAPFLLADTGLRTVPTGATRAPWRQILLGGGLMVAFGGWWWVVNLVRYHTFQPETPNFPLGDYLGDDWDAYLDVLFNGAVTRWWGAFGWFEVTLPTVFVRTASAIVIALFALGIIRARDGRTRVDLLFLLWPTLGLFGLMTFQSATGFSEHGHLSGISGRYMYGGLTALAVGVGMGAPAFGRQVARVFPVLFFGAAAAAQWWSIKTVLVHFWEPAGGDLADSWDALAAWSPWSPSTVITIVWVGVALAVLVLVSCVWTAVRGDTPPGGAGPDHPAAPGLGGGRNPAGTPQPTTATTAAWPAGPPGQAGGFEPLPTEPESRDTIPIRPAARKSPPAGSAGSKPDEQGLSEPPPGESAPAESGPSAAKGRPSSMASPVPSH